MKFVPTTVRCQRDVSALASVPISPRLVVCLGLMATLATACGPGSGATSGASDGASDGSSTASASAGDAAHGQELFTACAACHGPEGKGMPNLGKDITTSTFVAEKTDPEMVEFLKVGRPVDDPLNTTGVMMPPKGGNPALTDQDLLDLVAYVRELNTTQ